MTKLEQIRALKERRAAKGSRGGGKSRPAQLEQAGTARKASRSSTGLLEPLAQVDGVGVAPGPRETKPKKPKAAKKRTKRAKKPAPVSKVKVGRPRAEDRGKTLSDTKPWVAAKMSRASWYRQRAKP